MAELIENLLKANIEQTKMILELLKCFNITNEQFVLNWADSLNAISIEV